MRYTHPKIEKSLKFWLKKAVWIKQGSPRKKKLIASRIDLCTMDMSHEMNCQLFYGESPKTKFSETLNFWAWLDEK